MRSRTIREGSVGLLILAGLALFVGLILWIRGLNLSNRSYRFIVSFANVAGMQVGANVRYRGVGVGKITAVAARTNGVDVAIEVTPADLLMPNQVIIEANQSGLVGETSIDIQPQTALPTNALSLNPLSPECNSDLIICNGDRLQGQIGVSFDELLRNTIRLSALYTEPEFYNNLSVLTQSAATAATGVTQLTRELSVLSRSVRQELSTFSRAANTVTATANQTAYQVGFAASRFANTAEQFNQLAASANSLVLENRSTLVTTLNSVGQTSDQLRLLLVGLSPTLAQVSATVGQLDANTRQLNVGQLLRNLETLSTNATEASANLRDLSVSFNTPTNILLLQQTLDSARVTFENAQKITSDLEDLTGDPAFRNNLKELVNGLSNLVSSTEQLQQQVQVAQSLEAVNAALKPSTSNVATPPQSNQQTQPTLEQKTPNPEPTLQQEELSNKDDAVDVPVQ